ncbi:MAG: hypothetical protein IBX57_00540 [Gammaproteobacteria bacterium]|nr:hypothetical protein [Gammaproteobacteria bacterium]
MFTKESRLTEDHQSIEELWHSVVKTASGVVEDNERYGQYEDQSETISVRTNQINTLRTYLDLIEKTMAVSDCNRTITPQLLRFLYSSG